jgi:hypothetical protein
VDAPPVTFAYADWDTAPIDIYSLVGGAGGGGSGGDGQLLPGAVNGIVWKDQNGNGIRDATEPGLANVLVSLYTANGTLVATATTDANGNYTLPAVPLGNYYINFSQPAGYQFSPEGQGSDPTHDSDADLAGNTALFTLLSSAPQQEFDAGLTPLGG